MKTDTQTRAGVLAQFHLDPSASSRPFPGDLMRKLLLTCLLLAAANAGAQSDARSRGELLYSTHCIECHTAQMHWRAKRLARDWDTLRAQVSRWQGEARLGWEAEDVDAVAKYLNEAIYRFPQGQAVVAAPLRER